SPNPRNNPVAPLPMSTTEVLEGINALLVTHTHSDHWDATAQKVIPKNLPLYGQPEDEQKFGAAGFSSVQVFQSTAKLNDTEITRTGGQHGTGEIAKKMAPVSGFVLRAPGEPTLYVAGDTIWCPEVEDALNRFQPDIVVVNAGGARFLEGDPITMTADDVIRV